MRHRIKDIWANHRSWIWWSLLSIPVVFAGVIWLITESPTSSFIERCWTLISFAALIFTSWLVDDNVKNYQAVEWAIKQKKAVRYGPRWWIAVGSFGTSLAMFIVWVGFATIGVMSISIGPNASSEMRVWFGTVTGLVLIGMTTLLALSQVWQFFIRQQVRSDHDQFPRRGHHA